LIPKDRISKRQTKIKYLKETKSNRCYLALVADHKFYENIGNSNWKLTTAYMINIIGAINNIYTKTKWKLGDINQQKVENNDKEEEEPGTTTNYGFSIDKVIVLETPEPSANGENNHYNNKDTSKNADKVLELFGRHDWSKYCLAHLFTFQNFEQSVLGLAYVASPLRNALGGICSDPASSSSSSNRLLYVNTGLSSYKSTSTNQGRLLQKEAELVTAHGKY
jgi:disintegrin and metalloproteinase domain-containing protein 17